MVLIRKEMKIPWSFGKTKGKKGKNFYGPFVDQHGFWLSRNDRNEKLISKCRENSGSTKIFDTSTVNFQRKNLMPTPFYF